MTDPETVARNLAHFLKSADTRTLAVILDGVGAELVARHLPGIAAVVGAAHKLNLYASAQEVARAAEPIYSHDCTTRPK